jgi:hypothetical protein
MAETFQNNTVKLSSTNLIDVYTAPNNASTDRAVVLSAFAANVNGGTNTTISLYICDVSTNTNLSTLAYTVVLPADVSIELIPNKLILESGQKLRAQAGTANFVHFVVSALEIV